MRKILCLLTMLGMVAGCAAEQDAPDRSPESAAKRFLSLIDADNYEQSWNEAAAYIRDNVDAAQWTDHIGAYRKPLGTIEHREASSVEFEDALEDMPPGEYAFVTFDSAREGGLRATELVGLMQEGGSTWRVIGYQIL